jgi:hypothetical protein
MSQQLKISPLSLFHKLKWDLNKKPEARQIILETIKLLIKLPNRALPKSIKDEIVAIVLYYGTDLEESYKMFKQIYKKKPTDVHTILMMISLASSLGDSEMFYKLCDIVNAIEEDSYLISYVNIKNFKTLEEGNHVGAREMAHKINERVAKRNNMNIRYLLDEIDEPVLKFVEGPVYVYNHLIMKNDDILVFGTHQDETLLRDPKINIDKSKATLITTADNFYYCNPVYSNHYHALIEHIPIYNFVACRFPQLNYYKNINSADTAENGYNGFKPIQNNTLYLFKEGFHTFVLPRTKVPVLFDTYRPPDMILQEYRECLMKTYKDYVGPVDRPVIYLRRVGIRSFDYDEDLIKRLKEIYPSLVVFTGEEQEGQAEVFLNAKIIFGPHGAGFSNMIYAPSDCIIYEVGMLVEDNFFGSLAHTFKLKYYKDPKLKIRYYYKMYLDKYKTDLIILNIQRLLGDAMPHIVCDRL